LALAFDKCFVLHFGRNNPKLSYSFGETELQDTCLVKDLGVYMSALLKFSEHCAEIARIGFLKVRLIFSAFYNRNVDFLVKLFTVFVRPSLEYASEVWSPHQIKDIELVERVQRRFTKRIPGLSDLTYEQRLHRLNLDSLRHRRIVKDLVMVYRVIYGLVDLNIDDFFEFSREQRTRGHDKKLVPHRFRLDVRKNCFACRVVNYWNNLDQNTVNSQSTRQFTRNVSDLDFQQNGVGGM
jgi:DNA-binding HxlR family transcriptional regulator